MWGTGGRRVPAEELAEGTVVHCAEGEIRLALLVLLKLGLVHRSLELNALLKLGRAHRSLELNVLLVLVDRAQSKGGMTVSGYGTYDVLRFNGHCTTVMASDLFQFRPTVPDFAPIRWTRLKSKTRKALLKSKGITWRAGIRKNVCKSYGKRSLECEGSRLDLARVVAERLHKGQAIPVLKFIP